jgi:hypothetical protein
MNLYPTTVFVCLALAWNAFGQNSHPPRKELQEKSPASVAVSCSADRLAFSQAQASSCLAPR